MIYVNNYHRRIPVFDPINGMFTRLFCFQSFFLSLYFLSFLEAGDAELAEKEKGRIEEAQRSRSNIMASPNWFKSDGDAFILIGDEDPSHSYWKKREDHWSGVEFIPLW